MKSLFEEAVKRAAISALGEQLDTLVEPEDLVVYTSSLWPLRRVCYVMCDEFDDFEVRVYVGCFGAMRGIPKRAVVYTYG